MSLIPMIKQEVLQVVQEVKTHEVFLITIFSFISHSNIDLGGLDIIDKGLSITIKIVNVLLIGFFAYHKHKASKNKNQ